MSIWKVLNWAAWGLSAFFMALMIIDLIKVEKQRYQNENQDERANHDRVKP